MVGRLTIRHMAIVLATTQAAMAQQLNQMTYVGCYSSSSGLTLANSGVQYQTEGSCQQTCVLNGKNQAVLGLANKDSCYCGDQVPPNNAKADDSKCNLGCNGFGTHPCGGTGGFFTVYLTGVKGSVSAVGGGTITASSSATMPSISAGSSTNDGASSTTSTGPSVVTATLPGHTVTQIAAADSASGADSSGSGGPSVGPIVAGVVGGVLAVLGIVGLVFFLRIRKRRAIEEAQKEHQVEDFMRESKGSSAYNRSSMAAKGPDSRFDADAMANKRLSDGSIADNEDYSRRILKVTNA